MSIFDNCFKLQVNKSTQQVVLNSVDIEVFSATFTGSNGANMTANEIAYNKDEEKVFLNFSQNLPIGDLNYR